MWIFADTREGQETHMLEELISNKSNKKQNAQRFRYRRNVLGGFGDCDKE